MATQFDLTSAHLAAVDAARHWGLELGPPFALSTVSYVAPAGEFVVKVAWQGDDESLHEPEALALWDGDGAVRLRGRHGRAVLEERAVPGDDLAAVPEPDAVAAATATASKLWRRAQPPFRPVVPEVRRWLEAANSGSELVPLAREMLAQIGDTDQWLVGGSHEPGDSASAESMTLRAAAIVHVEPGVVPGARSSQSKRSQANASAHRPSS